MDNPCPKCKSTDIFYSRGTGVEPPCPRCDNKWQQPVTKYSHFAYGAGGQGAAGSCCGEGSSGLPFGVGGPEPYRTISTPIHADHKQFIKDING